MSREQFLNSFVLLFYEGVGNWKRASFSNTKSKKCGHYVKKDKLEYKVKSKSQKQGVVLTRWKTKPNAKCERNKIEHKVWSKRGETLIVQNF